MSKLNQDNRKLKIILLTIPVIFLFFFFYLPVLFLLQKALNGQQGFSLDPIISLLKDEWQVSVIIFTLKQALLSLIFTLLIGIPITFFLSIYQIKGQGLIRSVASIPFVLPAIVVALGFILLYGNNGYLNRILSPLNIQLHLLYNIKAIILAHVFYNIPVVIRIVGEALENLSENLIYSARSLGANKLQTLIKVVLPSILPAIINASILIFIYCFMSFGIILVLGHVKYTTIEVNIYMYIRQLVDFQKGVALSFIQIIFSLLFLNIYLRSNDRLARMNLMSVSQGRRKKQMLRHPLMRIFVFLVLFIFLLFIAGPIFSIIYFIFEKGTQFLPLLSDVVCNRYSIILGSGILTPLINSLILGLISATLSVVLSIMINSGNIEGKPKKIVELLLFLPMGISGIVFTLGYGLFFNREIMSSKILLICAHVIISLPFTYGIINRAFQSLNKNIILSAKTLGAGSWSVFFKIKIPMISRHILTAFIFAFALSFGEISAASILQDGFVTLPLAIFRFIGARQFYSATLLSVILILTSAICFIFSDRIREKMI